MSEDLDSISEGILKKMYEQCWGAGSSSMIYQCLTRNKNTVKDMIRKSAYAASADNYIIKQLSERGYVKMFEPGMYAITSFGAWYIEKKFYGTEMDRLLSYLQDNYFSVSNKPIEDKNKVVLLAVLSLRAFDSNHPLSYKTDEGEDALEKVLVECNDFLLKMGCISKSYDDNSKKSSKTVIGDFLNKINTLSDSTYRWWHASDGSYYVDVVANGEPDSEKIVSLMKIIFSVGISLSNINTVVAFCNNLCFSYAPFFDNNMNGFADAKYDNLMKSCVEKVAGL